jgi:Flp pilus assembly protein CpaB
MATGEVENKKQILIIVFALIAGGVASFLVGNYVTTRINDETQKLARQYEMAQKQKEQQFNEQLAALNQKIVSVEQSAKKAVEEAARLAAERASQQKTGSAAVVKKAKPSLAGRTPPGKRALTVLIDSLGAVGGLVNPGDYVDVIAHLSIPKTLGDGEEEKTKKETMTAMIFQKLLVLAINTNLDEPGAYDDQQKEKTLKITVAVTPEEAGLLAFADKNGSLELSLRPQNESGKSMIAAATWATLGDYVLQNHGADIKITAPAAATTEEADFGEPEATTEEATTPAISVLRHGKGL